MLAHCPIAMVAMSGLMTSIVSSMETIEYGCPPAQCVRKQWVSICSSKHVQALHGRSLRIQTWRVNVHLDGR